MRRVIIISTVLSAFLLSLMPLYAGGSSAKCATKYPIILVHGAGFKDENILGVNYWWRIPDALEDEGAEVYITNQDTFGSIADRAQQIAVELGQLFALNPGWGKVNLIAHSQGPLDCRYLTANCSIPGKGAARNYIASLTSISGVNQGSEIADLLWSLHNGIPVLGPALADVISSAVNLFAEVFYYNEDDQNSMQTLYNLTTSYVKNVFNPLTPNVAGVYYQSWGGKIKYAGLDLMSPLWVIMNLMGAGDNDGLVSIASARLGKWRGELTGAWWSNGVDHLEEVNQLFGITPGFDAPGFYVDVVSELKTMGY